MPRSTASESGGDSRTASSVSRSYAFRSISRVLSSRQVVIRFARSRACGSSLCSRQRLASFRARVRHLRFESCRKFVLSRRDAREYIR